MPFCFGLWYALNVAYNIFNKWALENVDVYVSEHTPHSSALPFTIACLQFGVGSLYACTVWTLGWRRPVPHSDELCRAVASFVRYIKKCCWYIAKLSRIDHILQPRHYTAVNSQDNMNRDGEHNNIQHTHPENPLSIRKTFRIAIYHTLGQICTVISLSANSIGFAHVIKAMEPLFSALVSRIILHQKMDIRVYLSLIPVVGGVVMACAGSNEFSWISFCAGMSSNAFFAMRAVASKIVMEGSSNKGASKQQQQMKALKSKTSELIDLSKGDDDVEFNDGHGKEHLQPQSKMSAANLFAAVTCISFLLSIPLTLLMEGEILWDVLHIAAKTKIEEDNSTGAENAAEQQSSEDHSKIFIYIITSGLFHYLNNEVMYLVLGCVHPITLAVGNTMKRVFIIAAGVLVFRTPVSLQTGIGSAIGIGGVFLYSMMKQWYGAAAASIVPPRLILPDKPKLTP